VLSEIKGKGEGGQLDDLVLLEGVGEGNRGKGGRILGKTRDRRAGERV